MFEEAQLYAPVTEGPDGVKVHLADDHPGAATPSTGAGATRSPPPRWPGRPACRSRASTTRTRSTGSGARSAASSRRKHERLACRAFRDAKAALALPEDHVPQLDEVTDGLQRADGLPLPPGGRARAARGVLRLARRPGLPLDAVPPAPLRAALHARAGHRARGRSGTGTCSPTRGSPRSSAWPARPRGGCSTPRPCSTSPTSSGSRSSSASCGRRASSAATARASCRRSARSTSSAARRSGRSTSTRWRPWTYDITHYQPILFARRRDGRAQRSRRRVLRRVRRRHAERLAREGRGGRSTPAAARA